MSVTPIPSDDDDDCDIYADLPEVKLTHNSPVKPAHATEFERADKELKSLRTQVSQLLADLEAQRTSNEKLKSLNHNLSCNISILYKTASAEIQRKDKTISDLRRELDDLCFRRRDQKPSKPNLRSNCSSTAVAVNLDTLRTNLSNQLKGAVEKVICEPDVAFPIHLESDEGGTKETSSENSTPQSTNETKKKTPKKVSKSSSDSGEKMKAPEQSLNSSCVSSGGRKSVWERLGHRKQETRQTEDVSSNIADSSEDCGATSGASTVRQVTTHSLVESDGQHKKKIEKSSCGRELRADINCKNSQIKREMVASGTRGNTKSGNDLGGEQHVSKNSCIPLSHESAKNEILLRNNLPKANLATKEEASITYSEIQKDSSGHADKESPKSKEGTLTSSIEISSSKGIGMLREISSNASTNKDSDSCISSTVATSRPPESSSTESKSLSRETFSKGEVSTIKSMKEILFSVKASHVTCPDSVQTSGDLGNCAVSSDQQETRLDQESLVGSPKCNGTIAALNAPSTAKLQISSKSDNPEGSQEDQKVEKQDQATPSEISVGTQLPHLNSDFVLTPTALSSSIVKSISSVQQKACSGTLSLIEEPSSEQPFHPPLPKDDPAPLPPLPQGTPPPTPGKISPEKCTHKSEGKSVPVENQAEKIYDKAADILKTSCSLQIALTEKKSSQSTVVRPENSRLSDTLLNSNENLLMQCPFKPRQRAKLVVVLEDAPSSQGVDSFKPTSTKNVPSAFTRCKSPDSKYKRTPLKKFDVHDNRLSLEYRHSQSQRSMYSSRHLSSVKSLSHMPERRSPSELLNGRSGRIVRLSHQDKIRLRLRGRRSRSLSPDLKRIKQVGRVKNSSIMNTEDSHRENTINRRGEDRMKPRRSKIQTKPKVESKSTSRMAMLFGDSSSESEEKLEKYSKHSKNSHENPTKARENYHQQNLQVPTSPKKSSNSGKETLASSRINTISVAVKESLPDDLEEDVIIVKRRPRSFVHLDNSENHNSSPTNKAPSLSTSPAIKKGDKYGGQRVYEDKDVPSNEVPASEGVVKSLRTEQLHPQKQTSKRSLQDIISSDDSDESSSKIDSDLDPISTKSKMDVRNNKPAKRKKL